MSPFLFGYDFYYLWAVGSLLHQGENPYDLAILQRQLDAIGWPASEHAQQFTHPVGGLWLYWLFAMLPFKGSLVVWSALSMALIVGCAIQLRQVLEPRRSASVALVGLIAGIFPATLGNLIWGQMNAVILVGITFFAWAFRRESYLQAGMFLSLVFLKPHLFVPLLVVVVAWELRARRLGVMLGCALGIALQLLASYLVAPHGFTWYLGSLQGVLHESLGICGATVGQLLDCSFQWTWIRPSLLAVGSACALWLVHRYGYHPRTLLSLIVPLSVCVAPYCWMHSFVVLIPAVLCLVDRAAVCLSERALRYLSVSLAMGSLPLIVTARYQVVWIFLSWAVFGAAVLLLPRAGMEGENKPI